MEECLNPITETSSDIVEYLEKNVIELSGKTKKYLHQRIYNAIAIAYADGIAHNKVGGN